jgi:ABC-type sulfate transport system permease component
LAHIGVSETYVLSSANTEVVQRALSRWLEVPAIVPVLIAGILLTLFYRALTAVEQEFSC